MAKTLRPDLRKGILISPILSQDSKMIQNFMFLRYVFTWSES